MIAFGIRTSFVIGYFVIRYFTMTGSDTYQKKRILIQLDPDPHPSVFDSVVALDAGADTLLPYGGVTSDQVRNLVHGAIFTRGSEDLHNTAIFIGGSNVSDGEALLKAALQSFFGPLRVSVMLDPNGSNTTAAAAVLVAAKECPLAGAIAVVLAGTGPVGRRAARLLARGGAIVRVGSRSIERAATVCQEVQQLLDGGSLSPHDTETDEQVAAVLNGAQMVIAAGAAGVRLLSADVLRSTSGLKVAIDLNAVPPAGIDGIEVVDRAVQRGAITCYGAIGVGSIKMKIHKAAIRRLFDQNHLVLDAEEIYTLAAEIGL